MGNKILCQSPDIDPDSAWKNQNRDMAENPMYGFVDLSRGGELIKAYEDHGPERVKEIARTKMINYLYNEGKGHVISKVEYVNWCNFMKAKSMGISMEKKSYHQLKSDFQDDTFNKFEPHEACWDLFKRGGVGETPFQLCYLMDTPVHLEVGKTLLEVFPKLALDMYEGEEYFGETALHIATIRDDLEAVQLLVKHGANVNQRATGRFFLPEDQKKNPKKFTNYDGYAYYGEYPLAFAACKCNQEIYDFLVDHGANPNLQDSFGNTVLHMIVINNQPGMLKYAVRHHKTPARTDITNKQNLTPLTLASKLGHYSIFREMLDLGSIEFWRFSTITCSAYPLAAIDSIGPNGDTNWHSAMMIIVNGEKDEHLEMLEEGGVIGQLLDDKWKTFAMRRFIVRLSIACIHLILFSIAIYTRPEGKLLLGYSGPVDGIRYFSEVSVCLSCLGTVLMETIEFFSQGYRSFLKNCSHAPAQTVYLLSCFLVLACIPLRLVGLYDAEDILLIIAAPGSWFFMLFFASGVKLTGPFVTMIYKMCTGDLFRFAIIYCIFLVGFTQGFFFLFRDIEVEEGNGVEQFSTLQDTILTLFQMTLGEFQYETFDKSRYPYLTKFTFATFMILMPILLLNMLIAMMGNTYMQVISKSEKEWRRQWAKIVVVLERGFSKKQLLKFQEDYSVRLAGPPKHHLGEYCDPSIKQRALVVIKTAPRSRAKVAKGAVINWQKLGKEIIRQFRDHQRNNSNKKFEVQKRRGTVPLDELGLPNISTTVTQLAWERDIDLTKGQTFVYDADQFDYISPRSDSGVQESAHSNFGLLNGSQITIPNGQPSLIGPPQHVTSQVLTVQSQLPSGNAPHRKRNFVYNRVAPLLPPLVAEDSSASLLERDSDTHSNKEMGSALTVKPLVKGNVGKAEKEQGSLSSAGVSIMTVNLKSLSSWEGDSKNHSVYKDTPQPLPESPKKDSRSRGFKDYDTGSSPEHHGNVGSLHSISQSFRLVTSPKRTRHHKKKSHSKGDKHADMSDKVFLNSKSNASQSAFDGLDNMAASDSFKILPSDCDSESHV